jgi:hypothetical protein
MNFGIIPETVRERLALRLGLVPLPIVDMPFGSMKARMISQSAEAQGVTTSS